MLRCTPGTIATRYSPKETHKSRLIVRAEQSAALINLIFGAIGHLNLAYELDRDAAVIVSCTMPLEVTY